MEIRKVLEEKMYMNENNKMEMSLEDYEDLMEQIEMEEFCEEAMEIYEKVLDGSMKCYPIEEAIETLRAEMKL
ncbi:MAG: hypothetical protein ACLROI_11385 [Beduini sp.]|uniref:hypothetical protein n=1 Tax=Beduini sp. TaxID=1922300 RepID=UPI0011CB86CE